MSEEQFAAIMPSIIADLVAAISEKAGITEEEAVNRLYRSQLYALLEQEDTKLWHYSTEMLYAFYVQEQNNGVIEFPDV